MSRNAQSGLTTLSMKCHNGLAWLGLAWLGLACADTVTFSEEKLKTYFNHIRYRNVSQENDPVVHFGTFLRSSEVLV